MKFLKSILLTALFALLINSNIFAQQTGSLSGQVVDSLGAVIIGSTVIVVDANGKEKNATTDKDGNYTINGLAPGTYTVRVTAPNFALYENTEVQIGAARREELPIVLTVEAIQEQVQVSSGEQISTDLDNNASATVLKGDDLDALPDDPDELESALQALAGPSAGPNGGQIYIDGFTGGRIPPKESIREIRINQNPFSAEYDRLGFGRVEILTKPGSDKFRGQAFFNFNDESLNSRNPFALNRAASQKLDYGGSVSGPLKKGKSSFFFDISNRSVDSGAVINATVLDSGLNVVPFQQEFTQPSRRFSVSPRFDYAINDRNTLVARYSFTRYTADNQSIGGFSLPTLASQTTNVDHDFQITETAIINPKTINETRFRYEFENRERTGDNSIPTINVASAFTGGGAQVGLSYNRQNNWEIQNYTTTTLGGKSQHSLKFGVRVRGDRIEDRSESNYGGTFLFSGRPEVRRTATCDPQTDPTCIVTPALSPIDQYRGKVAGNSDPRYNPNQFTITSGNPVADVSQTDVGLFVTDDWRVSPKLTLGVGLRYENQTNINDNFNLAPRFSFAYSPGAGGARPPKTVFRGGIGIFYDRFSDNYTLTANRFDGLQQFNYIVTNDQNILGQPVFTLNGVSNVPTAAQLGTVAPLANTIRNVSGEAQAPYTIQSLFTVERQLPFKTTLSATYVAARTLHLLRTRNINAPVCPPSIACPTSNAAALAQLRPDPSKGNIYQYETSGVSNQQQVIINFRSFLNPNFVMFGNYRLGFTNSDADGGFPAYSYDLSNEYGRSSGDTRHFFVLGGSFGLPWNIKASPFILASSGRPINFTTGLDTNGDSIFAERPTYAALNARCQQLGLTNSFCDISDVDDPNAIVPRNYGNGPSSLTVNLRLDKTFGFGKSSERPAAANNPEAQSGGRIPGVGGRGGRGGGGGGRGGFSGFGGERKPYNLTVGLNIQNLLNTTNLANPISNLNSSRFGQSVSTAGGFGGFRGGGFGGGGSDSGNRRVELQMRFSF